MRKKKIIIYKGIKEALIQLLLDFCKAYFYPQKVPVPFGVAVDLPCCGSVKSQPKRLGNSSVQLLTITLHCKLCFMV